MSDAMTVPGTVTITVTAEHIAKGKRKSCTGCPIALAARDALPDAEFIKVGPGISFVARGRVVRFDLPAEALDFIEGFDDGGSAEPFSFTVDRPAVIS